MAALRALEERDGKGITRRVNPTQTIIAAKDVRIITGSNSYRYEPNPEYHEPITVQVQEGEIKFFYGTPTNSETRALAKEIAQSDVPPYIIRSLKSHGIRYKEARPSVFEVKLARVGDIEIAEATELLPDAQGNVTVTAEMGADIADMARPGLDIPAGARL